MATAYKRPNVRKARSAAELEQMLGQVRTGWSSGDREFAVTAMAFLAERLFAIEERLSPPPKKKLRVPSAWQRFFANGMKAGKSPQQIGQEWRQRKVKRAS